MQNQVTKLSLVCLLMIAMQHSAGAQEADAPNAPSLSGAQQELVDLMTEYNAESETWIDAVRSYDTSEEREAALESGEIVDPGERFIPRLLEFEAEHRGEEVGLLALRQVFMQACSTLRCKSPQFVGRRKALARLAYYEQSPLLPNVVKHAISWRPQGYEEVYAICQSPTLPTDSRHMLQYYLAAYAFETRESQQYFTERVEVLRAGAEPNWAREIENNLALLEAWSSAEVLNQRCDVAILLLEDLAKRSPSPRFPDVEGLDNQWVIVRLLEESSEPSVAEKAAALLFKRRHLVVGAHVPDLEVSLVDDTPWKLADQIGKVVVIQFSFTGCEPCAAMYPDLAEMTAKYPDDLAVLTILRDPTPENALEGIDHGKFTWNITVDGDPGRLATKWSVAAFPAVYVIDKQGEIAAEDVRGNELKEEVARLIAEK